jgi:hypothetical protein
LLDGLKLRDFYLFWNESRNANDASLSVFVWQEVVRGCSTEFFGERLIRNHF